MFLPQNIHKPDIMQRSPSFHPSQLAVKKTKMTPSKKKVSFKKKATKPYIVYIGRQPFPLQMGNTLVYNDRVTITTNASGYGYYLFCANSIYDPNYTGTGHRPLYTSQCQAVYNHWVVTNSRITANFIQTETMPTANLVCLVDDDANPNLSVGFLAQERPGARSACQVPGAGTVYVKQWYNAEKMFGGDPLADSKLQGSVAANPEEEAYFVVWVEGDPASAGITAFSLNVRIEYDVVWSEHVSVTYSS